MQASANHVTLRHQLNDQLEIEQSYTCFLDSDRFQNELTIDAFKEALNPLLSKHNNTWVGRHKALINKDYL